MIAWERPWLLLGAALVAALGVASAALWHRRRHDRLARLGTDIAIARLAPAARSRAALVRAARLGVASVLVAIALAGPRFGTAREVIRTRGGDVVLAMDASLSMLADDERPSRLERLKQEVRRFRAASPGDRVGLIAFAGRAYVLSPLTADDGALELFLDNLDPSIVGQPGTAIAPAITSALDLLAAAQGGAGKAIVLLTDGEGFDDHGAALEAAKRAVEANVRVVTVGFGTVGGAAIPIRTAAGIESKRDEEGNVVVTRHDPAFLRDLADAAKGEFIAADATDKGTRIARALATLDARARASEAGLQKPARYQWLLAIAFFILLYDAWRADGGRWRWRRWRTAWRTRRRTMTAGIIVALAAALPARVDAQSLADRGLRHFTAGQLPEAIKSFRDAIGRGDRTPRTLYNFGTVLLAADSLDAAVDALERAAFGAAPTLRDRAQFNLGLANLKRARLADPAERGGYVRAALGAYRELLLAHPDDADARWNYELALRLRQVPPPHAGGGGARNDQQNAASQAKDPSQMSRQQAEQLLDAASRDEHDTQSRRRRQPPRERGPGGKDW